MTAVDLEGARTPAGSKEAAPVPFLSLRPVHEPLRDGFLADLDEVVRSGELVNGAAVARFEAAFAAFVGTRHCVGVASGLDALRIALLAAQIGPGDEVVLPAMTFVATAEAVAQAGALPVLVDVAETDYCMDPDAVEAACTPATRCLLPVHLYGQMCDVRRIGTIAARRRILVVEDACQAHGAVRAGLRAGTVGAAAAFSFYPGKNLGALGDAGALVTSDAHVASRARALREHGQIRKYRHVLRGYTARLDTFQALVLARKLRHLDAWNAERRRLAALYGELLDGVGDLVLPPVAADGDPVWHLYVVRTADPDGLARFLGARGIGTGRHYPTPIHLAPAFADLGYARGSFPVAEALAAQALSLPLYPGLQPAQVETVAHEVRRYFDSGAHAGE